MRDQQLGDLHRRRLVARGEPHQKRLAVAGRACALGLFRQQLSQPVHLPGVADFPGAAAEAAEQVDHSRRLTMHRAAERRVVVVPADRIHLGSARNQELGDVDAVVVRRDVERALPSRLSMSGGVPRSSRSSAAPPAVVFRRREERFGRAEEFRLLARSRLGSHVVVLARQAPMSACIGSSASVERTRRDGRAAPPVPHGRGPSPLRRASAVDCAAAARAPHSDSRRAPGTIRRARDRCARRRRRGASARRTRSRPRRACAIRDRPSPSHGRVRRECS